MSDVWCKRYEENYDFGVLNWKVKKYKKIVLFFLNVLTLFVLDQTRGSTKKKKLLDFREDIKILLTYTQFFR